VWTVSSITANDGLGSSYTTTYGYKGGFFDTAKKEFRGFNQVTVTDPLGAKTITYFHQSGGRDESANGEFEDQSSMAKKGLPYRVEIYGTNGALYRRTLNKIEEASLGGGWTFPYVAQTIQMVYEGLGDSYVRATAQKLTYDNATGNVILSEDVGEVSGVNFATHGFADVDTSDSLYTITTYTNIGSIQNKPLAITVSKYSSGSPALRQSLFKYDGKGNLTETKAWLDATGGYLTNGIVSYDSVGNPTQSTDDAGITTTTTYDSATKTFPIKTVTATFTNETLADPRFGGVVWAKDPNGLTATNLVDVFFRTVETRVSTNASSGPTLWRTKTDYTLGGVGNGLSANFVRQRVFDPNDTSNGIESYTYTDGLGRGIQTRAESETNGVWRVSDVFFDGRGNVAFATLPYFSSGSAFTLNLSTTRLGTYTDYDPIGRAQIVTPAVQATFNSAGQITSVTDTGGDTGSPVDSTTTAYFDGTNPWAKAVTDAEGKSSKSYFDAFGRVTQIVNVVSGGNINTWFKYDPVGNLTNVTDHAGNITRIVYDSLGRKTSMTEPNMGTWTYAYDHAGRLTNQVDAKSQKIVFWYTNEPLGRLVAKFAYTASGSMQRSNRWFYDSNLGDTGFNVL
jgi:YD repeat-containing protein